MKLYGLESAITPTVALPYLVYMTDFTVPVALLNNAVITGAMAGAAWYRSRQISKDVGRRYRDRLEPVWPFLTSILLAFLAALQLIFAVTHLSYYRTGHLISDVFDQ